MEKNMKSFKIDRIIFAVGAIAIGIILLVWPSTSLMIMGKCIGAFLAGGGLVAAFMFFRDHESAMKSVLLIMAAVMLICGIVIFLHPDDLVKLIPTIMGILVMISGLINLGETFVLTRSKYSKWWISLIVSIITIAAGIFLIRNAFNLASIITRIAGGILIFDGISDLWVISRISKAEKDAKTEASAVDVTAEVTEAGEAAETAGPQPEPVEGASNGAANGDSNGNANGASDAPAAAGIVEAEKAAETAPQDPSGMTQTQAPSQNAGNNGPAKDPVIPEYMSQTDQDTDYSAFSEQDPAGNRHDE